MTLRELLQDELRAIRRTVGPPRPGWRGALRLLHIAGIIVGIPAGLLLAAWMAWGALGLLLGAL